MNGFNDYFEINWEQLLSYIANSLLGNSFPVNVFFTTFAMEKTPAPVAPDRPVLHLALFGAVSLLLAPATELDSQAADLAAEAAVHENVPLIKEIEIKWKVKGIVQVYTFGWGDKLVAELISPDG